MHLPAVIKGNEVWRSQVHRAHMLDITALIHDRLLTGGGGGWGGGGGSDLTRREPEVKLADAPVASQRSGRL